MSRWIILFDWDGTLIDSLDIKVHNAGALFEEVFGTPHARIEAAYRQHSGIPRRQLFDAICADNGLPSLSDEQFGELGRRFSKMNRATISKVAVSQDVISALKTLTERGYPLYVSSAAEPAEVRDVARALELDGFFCDILGSVHGFTKGLPHIEHVLRRYNARRSNVVFVGDEPADVVLGREAGVLTVAKAGTYTASRLAEEGPDHIIESLSELLAVLDGRS